MSLHSSACRLAIVACLVGGPAMAGALWVGSVTGLPVPRFVSVKSKPANVRVGPGVRYPLQWTFVRRFMPVEVTAEFGQWRRIRDWDGSEGWILGAFLSGRRTALVAPWQHGKTAPLRSRAAPAARVIARLQDKVLVRVEGCDGRWCEVRVRGKDGFIRQTQLWGVYPGEKI